MARSNTYSRSASLKVRKILLEYLDVNDSTLLEQFAEDAAKLGKELGMERQRTVKNPDGTTKVEFYRGWSGPLEVDPEDPAKKSAPTLARYSLEGLLGGGTCEAWARDIFLAVIDKCGWEKLEKEGPKETATAVVREKIELDLRACGRIIEKLFPELDWDELWVGAERLKEELESL
jgi:hypothetical protein